MNAIVKTEAKSLLVKFADRYSVDANKMMGTLAATAFKQRDGSAPTNEQMMALLVVAKHIDIDERTGCWNWTSARNGKGYGQLTFKGAHYTAHRFSLIFLGSGVRDDMCALHHCDNRACINPEHLYEGTYKDNRRDMLERSGWEHPYSKRTHCFAGHKYKEGSYRIAKDGSRVCRECMKQHMREWRKKNSEAHHGK